MMETEDAGSPIIRGVCFLITEAEVGSEYPVIPKQTVLSLRIEENDSKAYGMAIKSQVREAAPGD